uniref:Uncharacterized protein n=1 Tax=Arundo donax TaxID=35708 RepID=A0A0A9G8E7_ARUDO
MRIGGGHGGTAHALPWSASRPTVAGPDSPPRAVGVAKAAASRTMDRLQPRRRARGRRSHPAAALGPPQSPRSSPVGFSPQPRAQRHSSSRDPARANSPWPRTPVAAATWRRRRQRTHTDAASNETRQTRRGATDAKYFNRKHADTRTHAAPQSQWPNLRTIEKVVPCANHRWTTHETTFHQSSNHRKIEILWW